MESALSIKDILKKALQQMVFPFSNSNWLLMPRTSFNYEKEVNGWQSAIIMACIGWIQRTFPEAPLFLRQRNKDGSWDDTFDHAMLELIDTPNPYYDGILLQQATVADFNISGNAYWRIIRSAGNRAVQLWWIPSTLIEPKWDSLSSGNSYIDFYNYTTGGIPEEIDPLDIVHFRYGLDPNNMRKGLSPLASLFREVFSDDEAANMTATLLKNMGVPGVVVSPKDANAQMNSQVSQDVKQWFKEMTTSDRRGEPLVMSGTTDVVQFGFNPQQMDLKSLRRIPEERVSGVLGVPAIVAGLGAGLDRSTFANMAEAREMAFENNIIPTQRVFGSVIKRQLLINFEKDITNWQVAYDLSEVRILQEDENKKAERISRMVSGGYITIADAQRETGVPVDETQNIYLRPINVMETPAGYKSDRKSDEKLETKEWTEERKSLHWKRIDNRRMSWWANAEQKILPLYEDEGKAVEKALKKSPKAHLADSAEKAIKNREPEWVKRIEALDLAIIEDFGKEIFGDFGKSASPDGLKWEFDPFKEAVKLWVSQHVAEGVTSILATNVDDVKRIIQAGIEANKTIPQISKELRQFYDDRSVYKAMRVARTEVGAAAGFGQHESAKQSGVVQIKHWISSRDERVRDSHAWMDGEEKLLEEKYSNGLMYPGDTSGDPAEFIMCRCVEGYKTR